jgi:prevent-host-death family protein
MTMQLSLTEAKARLTDLVRRAEAGDDVVLTRRGRPAVRLVPVRKNKAGKDERWALLEALRGSAKKADGISAARSADFLYDDDGLPA